MKSSSFYCHHTFIVHARILLPRAYRRNLKRQEFELKNWVRLVLKEPSNSTSTFLGNILFMFLNLLHPVKLNDL